MKHEDNLVVLFLSFNRTHSHSHSELHELGKNGFLIDDVCMVNET